MAYRASASEEEGFKWDWNHKAPGARQPAARPNTAIDLAAAMRENPYLKVLSLNGWYDMATPFFGTEYDLNHMMLEPAQQRNLEFRYYPSGHMVYLNPDALHAMRLDVERFIYEAVGEARHGAPPAAPRRRASYPQQNGLSLRRATTNGYYDVRGRGFRGTAGPPVG